ncbi:hypothetical protein [Ekhidna sp.]|uniref:hypothetical protein n=1 Tax=Ekhidna sp. TaxID=2608089 RepID=UPI003B50300F
MKPIHYLLFGLILSCSSAKNSNSTSEFQLDDIEIGQDQTALIGKISGISNEDSQLIITLEVIKSRQGGTSAPSVAANSTIEAECSKIFLRSYKDKAGSELSDNISEGDEALVIVKKSLKDQRLSVHNIKSTKL